MKLLSLSLTLCLLAGVSLSTREADVEQAIAIWKANINSVNRFESDGEGTSAVRASKDTLKQLRILTDRRRLRKEGQQAAKRLRNNLPIEAAKMEVLAGRRKNNNNNNNNNNSNSKNGKGKKEDDTFLNSLKQLRCDSILPDTQTLWRAASRKAPAVPVPNMCRKPGNSKDKKKGGGKEKEKEKDRQRAKDDRQDNRHNGKDHDDGKGHRTWDGKHGTDHHNTNLNNKRGGQEYQTEEWRNQRCREAKRPQNNNDKDRQDKEWYDQHCHDGKEHQDEEWHHDDDNGHHDGNDNDHDDDHDHEGQDHDGKQHDDHEKGHRDGVHTHPDGKGGQGEKDQHERGLHRDRRDDYGHGKSRWSKRPEDRR
ncbi:hypothetical protein LOZ61_002675 [Ophidiomyces ophidiicola]|nr:hypothetical protein LOZ61_002675 [Ophidiomyces ophidiicola]KAI1930259.1 hypothetical protein LOZ60_001042 [Ophidiomyces ophidiicola]KAI1968130.1 hypothetical protein LOZ59_000491 [Ophidiomyces ophidiicola]KAI2024481.1 hypothetical protein LOZ46_001172 [Ophidiomyces ophidiicola]KAI2096132.1 hypothetical protein LOZ33_003896 [Ophidiomyces ophidiicola]